MSLISNIKNQYNKQQHKLAVKKQLKIQIAADEEARHQQILAGKLEPITISARLRVGETAYLELTARRMALVGNAVDETVGTTKKQHVIKRAVVGGVLTGGVGAIVGAATAGTNNISTTTHKLVRSVQHIDSGQLLLTSERFIFIGNDEVLTLPYEKMIAVSFSSNELSVKYSGMLSGEYYEIFGAAAKDIQLYYHAITQHLDNTRS